MFGFGDGGGDDRPSPHIGEGQRVYAIGDVHGCAGLLRALLALIDADDAARPPARTSLILLGDLIDRGPDSARVVADAMALAASGAIVLKGNHEEMFVAAARGDRRAVGLMRRYGVVESCASYGLPPETARAMDDAALAAWMLAHVPRDHVDFLDDLPDRLEMGDYLFVHAGIRPHVDLARQKGEDLRWIREPFLSHDRPFARMVVHGHTITADVDEQANRIGIDTGAWRSGLLTAIGLEGDDRWYVQARGAAG